MRDLRTWVASASVVDKILVSGGATVPSGAVPEPLRS